MAGAGYKLFNTGDVLTAAQVNTYLMEQTVMVFADAAARTTALTGVVSEGMISYLKDTNAVEVYNGSAWVASDDPNAIQNTIINAKGDLIAGSANDTPAILSVGNSGETIVADSAATTGLRYTSGVGFTQPVINGAFDIWQRATSGTLPGGTFDNSYVAADRWKGAAYNGSLAATFSRQNTGDTTNLPFIQFCGRVQRNSGNAVAAKIALTNVFENVNSTPFIGRTVTLSFYARKGANYSSASDALTAYVYSGTGTNQPQPDIFTGAATPVSGTATLTSTWQRFSYTGTISSSATQIAVWFEYTASGTAGAADFFEVTGVQIDLGQTALPFRRSGGTLQGELVAAMRYFQRIGNGADNTNENFGAAQCTSTTAVMGGLRYLVPMRSTPTLTISSAGHFGVLSAVGNVVTATALTFQQSTPRNTRYDVTVASGLVAGNATIFLANSASATLDASSEL